MTDIKAQVEAGDPFPGEDGPEYYATVSIALTPDRPITFILQRSLVYGDTINVEIDGDFTEAFPSLRIHMNDGLVLDTTAGVPALEDPRGTPDHPEPIDDIVDRLVTEFGDVEADPTGLLVLANQVHDIATNNGNEINRSGLDEQIRFLLDAGTSEDDIRDWLSGE